MKKGDTVFVEATYLHELGPLGVAVDCDLRPVAVKRERVFPDLKELLTEVANDFETAGCEGMGTVSIATMNKVRKVLGWEPLVDAAADGPCPDEGCPGSVVNEECSHCGTDFEDKRR